MSQPTALITAAGAGIGRAIAEAFARADYAVHAVDIDADAIAETARALPESALCSVADVADVQAVSRVFAEHRDRFADIDVLVNCAGIAGPTALLEDIELDEWRRCIAVNLDATFLCCRQSIPMMRAAKRGCIINIASTAGWHGYPLRTPYAAAKWGVIGVTKSLAMELGPVGVRVNVICPGSIEGARMQRVIQAEAAHQQIDEAVVRQRYEQSASLRTFIQPNDIADSALFLASDASAKITGQVINVDGHLESFGAVDARL